MAHLLENLTSEQIRLIAADPLTADGRALLLKISGADKPYASLDEMHADKQDLYGEQLQSEFEADQAIDDE